jgi:replicative DNA helicase
MLINVDLEKQVLGQLVLEGNRYYDVSDKLTEKHFNDPFNRGLYKCIVKTANSSVIDLITITETAMNSKHEFPSYLLDREDFSLAYEIATMSNDVGSTIHLEEHINILNEYRKKRDLRSLESLVKNSIEAGEDANDIIAKLSSKVMEISDITSKGELNMTGCLEEFQKFLNSDVQSRLNPTGITEVDRVISGFEYSDLVIVAGAASMGKTSFAMKLLHNFLMMDKKVHMFSLEMNTDQLMTRLVSMITSITINRMRNKQCDDADLRSIENAIQLLHDRDMIIDTQSSKLHQVINKIRKSHMQNGLDIVIIDYLQLISHQVKGNKRAKHNSCSVISIKQIGKY